MPFLPDRLLSVLTVIGKHVIFLNNIFRQYKKTSFLFVLDLKIFQYFKRRFSAWK